jgi:pseudolysin
LKPAYNSKVQFLIHKTLFHKISLRFFFRQRHNERVKKFTQGAENMYKYHKLLALSTIALCTTSAFAAKPINLNNQTISSIQFLVKPTTSLNTRAAGLKEISRDVDQNATAHIRVQETFANYPVWGGDAILHVPQGGNKSITALNATTTMNGIVYQDLQADLTNTPAYIFETKQADKVFQYVTELYQKKSGIKKFDLVHAKKNLMVYVDKDNKAHWAFFISFLSSDRNGMIAAPTYIIDANTLTVYMEWNDAQTLEDTQAGGFGGNEKMGKLVYDGSQGNYPTLNIQRDAAKKICYLQNTLVTVMDQNKPHDWLSDAPTAQFSCNQKNTEHSDIYWNADQDAINGAYSPANDALYIGQVIKEMYQKWYNIPVLSFFGYPMMLKMNVHTKDNSGGALENAMFLSLNNEMYFGDGLDMFYPLTSLGVGAHEISHGFTSQHANLTYATQSGGLNESFSDMAAQAAEFYSTGKNSWQIGPEIVKSNKALRYMDDPTKDGKSIANIKDYNDALNVHYSSGIFNKAFYLLSTTSGWDTKKAFDVMVNANMHYWTANSTFIDAACGAKKAAKDLNYDITAVTAATNGVGIDTSRC